MLKEIFGGRKSLIEIFDTDYINTLIKKTS